MWGILASACATSVWTVDRIDWRIDSNESDTELADDLGRLAGGGIARELPPIPLDVPYIISSTDNVRGGNCGVGSERGMADGTTEGADVITEDTDETTGADKDTVPELDAATCTPGTRRDGANGTVGPAATREADDEDTGTNGGAKGIVSTLEIIAGASRMLVDGGTEDALDDFRYLRLAGIVGKQVLNSVSLRT